MSKTSPAAAEPIDVDNEVDIDNIDWEQEERDADRLFTDWVEVDVEVLPGTLPAPVPAPLIVASRYFLRSSLKITTLITTETVVSLVGGEKKVTRGYKKAQEVTKGYK